MERNEGVLERGRTGGAVSVDKDREAFALAVAVAGVVVEDGDVVAVVAEIVEGEVVDGAVGGWEERGELEGVVAAGADADEAAEDEVDVGGVLVVVGAGEADDGPAGVWVVVLLQVEVAEREVMLVGVLAEEAEVVGGGDDGLGWVVVEEVGEAGKELRGLEGPGWAVPLALGVGAFVTILGHVAGVGGLDGAETSRAGEFVG
jgi:hypothetical protein